VQNPVKFPIYSFSDIWASVMVFVLSVLRVGISNILGSFVSAYPVTASFSRFDSRNCLTTLLAIFTHENNAQSQVDELAIKFYSSLNFYLFSALLPVGRYR